MNLTVQELGRLVDADISMQVCWTMELAYLMDAADLSLFDAHDLFIEAGGRMQANCLDPCPV